MVIAGMITFALPNLKNTIKVSPTFRFLLVKADPDDDKFIVSNDHHFNILKTIDFPVVDVVTLEEFKEILNP